MEKLIAVKEVGFVFLKFYFIKGVKSHGFKDVFSSVLFHACFAVLLIQQKGLILTLLIEGKSNGVYIFPTG